MRKLVSKAQYRRMQQQWNPATFNDPDHVNYMVDGPLKESVMEMAKEVYELPLEEFIERTEL